VGIGMRVAMYLSVKKLGLAEEVYNTYSQWLNGKLLTTHYPLPTFNLKDIEQMLPLMHQDKKNADGELRCVLLQEPGAAVIDITVSDNEVRDAFLQFSKS
jgi:3-dehydroquinate synthetase